GRPVRDVASSTASTEGSGSTVQHASASSESELLRAWRHPCRTRRPLNTFFLTHIPVNVFRNRKKKNDEDPSPIPKIQHNTDPQRPTTRTNLPLRIYNTLTR